MPKRPIEAKDLLRFVFVGDPQISPDAERVLFSKKIITDKNKYQTHICSVDLEGKIIQWTQGEESCSHGRWSSDGSQIAFISGRDKPSSQIFIISTNGGEAKKLTKFPEGSISGFKWSPDGTMLAASFRESLAGDSEEAKKEREANSLSDPPLETDDVWYREDGDGYFGMHRHKLYFVDVESGEHRLAYDKNLVSFEFDWSPNSKELVLTHSIQKRPFADPPNEQIFRLDLNGQAWMLEGLPRGTKSNPKWSPDGNWIAYAANEDEEDPWGTRNSHLCVVSAKGGTPKDLSVGCDYDLDAATLSDTKEAAFGSVFGWTKDGSAILAQIGWHGETQIGKFDPKSGGGCTLVTEGRHFIGLGNVVADSRIPVVYGHSLKIPEIAVVEPELGTGRMVPRVLTDFNGAFHQEVVLSEPEEFWLDSTDGSKLHVWAIKPINYLEPRRYPAVLQIHGGPHAQYGWAYFHEFQVLAASGYAVVYTNPRGSKGYGEAHCTAIKGDWGNKDWEDIQTATRWMQSQPHIHPGQMGVMGGSYGGYMTNWVIGHTDEFKAAITDRCVSNIVSMAGSSDFPFNKDAYFKGVPWGDLESIRELWRQSPIAYFENVTTPTLVIHSEGDLRCNIEQGEQVFAALQMLGVESRFVRYPKSTSHGLSRSGPPDLRLHRLGEILKWWEKHLKVSSEARELAHVL